MQESNLKQFETSSHPRHRQLVFKRPGFLGSGSERGMEYGFNCFADRARHRDLTKHLEEMGFLGRDGLRETRMLTSENLHEGALCTAAGNKQ